MTRNELLELANAFYTGGFTEREIAFARVIAAVEREACAKVCESHVRTRHDYISLKPSEQGGTHERWSL